MKAEINYTLPEINEEPIITETKDVVSNSSDKVFGRLIILPEVDTHQKIKCISSCGEESFTYKVRGKVYLDFPSGIKDVDIDGEVTTVWIN